MFNEFNTAEQVILDAVARRSGAEGQTGAVFETASVLFGDTL
jgi:hypothetical protein